MNIRLRKSPVIVSSVIALFASALALAAPQGMGMSQSQQGMHQGDMQQSCRQGQRQGGMHNSPMGHDRMPMHNMSMPGCQLMTAKEWQAFHQQMRNAETAAERQQLMAQHRAVMSQRAEQRGADFENRPIFGRQLMTREERDQYRKQLLEAKTDEEREAIRAQHHKDMLARARQRNGSLDAADSNDD